MSATSSTSTCRRMRPITSIVSDARPGLERKGTPSASPARSSRSPCRTSKAISATRSPSRPSSRACWPRVSRRGSWRRDTGGACKAAASGGRTGRAIRAIRAGTREVMPAAMAGATRAIPVGRDGPDAREESRAENPSEARGQRRSMVRRNRLFKAPRPVQAYHGPARRPGFPPGPPRAFVAMAETEDNVDRELFRNMEKLRQLRIEHRDLDEVITRLSLDVHVDELQLKRLKKRKLMLKDQITRLESELIPDLNA